MKVGCKGIYITRTYLHDGKGKHAADLSFDKAVDQNTDIY